MSRVRSGHCATWAWAPAWSHGSIRLRAGELDHLAPLLGFIGDQLAEILWRAWNDGRAEAGKRRLQLGIGEARIDLAVEQVDDVSGRVPRCADAVPRTRLVARH